MLSFGRYLDIRNITSSKIPREHVHDIIKNEDGVILGIAILLEMKWAYFITA
jgi:hypothetical protein